MLKARSKACSWWVEEWVGVLKVRSRAVASIGTGIAPPIVRDLTGDGVLVMERDGCSWTVRLKCTLLPALQQHSRAASQTPSASVFHHTRRGLLVSEQPRRATDNNVGTPAKAVSILTSEAAPLELELVRATRPVARLHVQGNASHRSRDRSREGVWS